MEVFKKGEISENFSQLRIEITEIKRMVTSLQNAENAEFHDSLSQAPSNNYIPNKSTENNGTEVSISDVTYSQAQEVTKNGGQH